MLLNHLRLLVSRPLLWLMEDLRLLLVGRALLEDLRLLALRLLKGLRLKRSALLLKRGLLEWHSASRTAPAAEKRASAATATEQSAATAVVTSAAWVMLSGDRRRPHEQQTAKDGPTQSTLTPHHTHRCISGEEVSGSG
jgi:hypothetical protein